MRKRIFGRRNLLVFVTLCVSMFVLWSVLDTNENMDNKGISLDYQLLESSDFKQRFTIKTAGCQIPAMTPLDPSIKKFITPPNPEICAKPSDTLLDHNNTHIWTNKEIAQRYKDVLSCCYRAFNRTQYVWIGSRSIDERVSYHKCVNFSDHILISNEFVRVTCYNSTNVIQEHFFLFATKKKFIVHRDKEKINGSGYNVLVMGIDSVSRLNFYRTMPKTVKYLKQNGAVEMIGYNKVGDNTFPNLIPMLLGISVEELRTTCLPHKRSTFDNCPFVWEWFKQAGYYTALGEDNSKLGTFNYLRSGFIGTPTDYYLHTFFSEVEKNMKKTKNSICSNDKYLFQKLLDYAEDLTKVLKSSKLFGFFWEITMSHDYLNNAAAMDDSYFTFLKTIENNKYLEETILILVSDHGMRWGRIRTTKQGRLEERLPFVFVLAPPSFQNNYTIAFNNLKINSKRFTTPYNLHAMMKDLVDLENINNANILSRSNDMYWHHRNISLFLPIPGNRTCQLAGIRDHWCTCHKDIPMSTEDVLVKEASEYLIKYVNEMLNEYELCAELSIAKLLEAREMIVGKVEKNEKGWREFLIVVRTRPGNGEFEATVRHYDYGQWAVAGQVSRLNLYGDQSSCIDNSLLKLYCYCV